MINKCYCMDNLELMKQMEDESVDLIYCDILYNTGRKFKDFDDDLGTTQQTIEWYRPRIIEMKRILKDTGQIYLHMDFRLCHYMKVLLDEIFGEKNFINEIIWAYRTGGVSKRYFQRKHDNILRYSKTDKYTHNSLFERSYMSHKYGFKELIEHYDKEQDKWYRDVHMRDVWDIDIVRGNVGEKVDYSAQKPIELLKRIIQSSSNEGDIVADFFCGSGTTGVVAKELGRNYILCDINPKAIKISEQRLKEMNDND
jgi:site-specific DNA-methyltransferase (adenine-specific)